MKKMHMYLLVVVVSAGAVCADDEIFDQNQAEITSEHVDKSLEDLVEFDPEEDAEFADLDFMVDKMTEADMPKIQPQPWWRSMLISLGASLYMKYRAMHKWLYGNNNAQ